MRAFELNEKQLYRSENRVSSDFNEEVLISRGPANAQPAAT